MDNIKGCAQNILRMEILMKKSRTNLVMINASLAAISQILTLVMLFVMQTFFIKFLGANYLGINGLFKNILSFLSFAELGIGGAMIYSLYEPLANEDHAQVSAIMNVFRRTYQYIGCTILTVGLMLTPFITMFMHGGSPVPYPKLLFVLYLLNTVVSYFFTYKRSLLIANQQGYKSTINTFYFMILQNVIQILILYFFEDYILFLIVQIITTLLSNIVISKMVDKEFNYLNNYRDEKVSTDVITYMKKNIVGTISAKIGTIIVFGTDNIIISTFMSVYLVGLYSNYMLVISGVTTLLNQIVSSVTASIGNLNVASNKKRQSEVFYQYMFVNTFLVFMASTLLYGAITGFITLWVGKSYSLMFSTVTLIIINFIINQMRQPVLSFISSYGLYWPMRWKSLIEAGINLVVSLSLVLIFKLGINGVILGTIISNLVINIWWEPYILLKKGLQISAKKYINTVIIQYMVMLLGLTGSYYLQIIFPVSNFFELVELICLIGLLALLTFLCVFYKTSEMKYFLSLVTSKIKFNKY